MTKMELIRGRRSVRTFDGNALKPEDADKILNFARETENPWGIPITWKLLSAKGDGLNVPVIVGADTYIAGKMRQVPHAEEAFGYAFEKVVLYAQGLGIGTTWIAGTMDRPAFERAMDLGEGERMPCVSPLGYPAERMSVRETLMRKGVKADTRFPFADLFFEDSFSTPLSEGSALAEALEMVRWAPSAVNKQPWRVVVTRGSRAHFYEQRSRGFTDASGWDLQKVDLGIALCHFACAFDGNVTLTDEDPGIAAPEGAEYVGTVSIGRP